MAIATFGNDKSDYAVFYGTKKQYDSFTPQISKTFTVGEAFANVGNFLENSANCSVLSLSLQ